MIRYESQLCKRIDDEGESLIKLLSDTRKALDEASKLAKNHIEVRNKELAGLEKRISSKTIDIDGAAIKYVYSLVNKVESLTRELKRLT